MPPRSAATFNGSFLECMVAPSGREYAGVIDHAGGHFTLIPKPPEWDRMYGRTIHLSRDREQKIRDPEKPGTFPLSRTRTTQHEEKTHMDNSSKRRVGRPKASPQTGPLVLEGSRARLTMELPMAEETADELNEYVRWVELSSTVTTKDALFATVDFALRDVFRRDRLWQEQRRKAEGAVAAMMSLVMGMRASEIITRVVR